MLNGETFKMQANDVSWELMKNVKDSFYLLISIEIILLTTIKV